MVSPDAVGIDEVGTDLHVKFFRARPVETLLPFCIGLELQLHVGMFGHQIVDIVGLGGEDYALSFKSLALDEFGEWGEETAVLRVF